MAKTGSLCHPKIKDSSATAAFDGSVCVDVVVAPTSAASPHSSDGGVHVRVGVGDSW